MITAWDEGARAFIEGIPFEFNPYDVGSGAYMDWNDGWKTTQDVGYYD